METTELREVVHDVPPWIKVYKDGKIERLVGYEVVPATFDSQTGVTSKDVLISPDTAVSARLYRPTLPPTTTTEKLPLFVYFHGGAFCVASSAEPKYHNSLNQLVAEAKIVVVSVDYRLAPEHPLPAAYDDCWAALGWVAAHASSDGGGTELEDWLKEGVDFDRVFIGGDSAGATIAHHIGIRVTSPGQDIGFKIQGVVMIHPYFWGKDPIGAEVTDVFRKSMVDKWWEFVCTSDKGLDDPFINPFADGSPDISDMGCDRVIVCVAEKDILRDRGRYYYEALVKSKWEGKAEMVEVDGEDHVFHIFNPNCEKAVNMIKALATFIKQE